jgi:VanZ family protein
MLPLRYTRRWLLAGGFALLAVFAAALAPGFWSPHAGRLLIGADKWLHAATFMILALWFCGQYTRRAYWQIGLWLLAFGILIELCQRMLTYRSGDLRDLAADAAGILIGLALARAGIGGWSLRAEDWLTQRRSRA